MVENIDLIIDNRYQILDLLGEGGIGKTYRAIDLNDRTEVAIKVLSLRGMDDWKTLELFEREAKILDRLEHRSIPRYLDYFRIQIEGEEAFCLVQEIAPGRSLTSWVESGYIFSEEEVRGIATQILEILSYLQTFTPPIIHRDLKPQNIIRTDTGKIYLVDFGAVRDTYHLTITGGSTIVGTYGYMAPEQFRGQAVLATDLYGLGATLLYLKSGQDPADLPVKNMKIDFRNRVQFSPNFANWLDGLLQPIPEDRYPTADRALAALDGKTIDKFPRPKHSIAQISQQGEDLKIVIPPIWLATRDSKKTLAVTTSLFLLSLFSWWLIQTTVLPGAWWLIFLFTGLIFLPWTFGILCHFALVVMCQRELKIIDRQVICTTKLLGKTIQRWELQVEDIKHVGWQKSKVLGYKGGLQLMMFGKEYFRRRYDLEHSPYLRKTHSIFNFGKYLDRTEQLWLRSELLEHLQYLDPTIDRSHISDSFVISNDRQDNLDSLKSLDPASYQTIIEMKNRQQRDCKKINSWF